MKDNSILWKVITNLKKIGKIVIINPNKFYISLMNNRSFKEFDIICSMSRDPIILSLLSIHESFGTTVINPTDSVWIANNRVALLALLYKEGIQIPKTIFIYNGNRSINSLHRDGEMFELMKGKIVKVQRRDFKMSSVDFNSIDKLNLLLLKKDIIHIIQDFIKFDIEIKVYVIGKKIYFKKHFYLKKNKNINIRVMDCIKENILKIGELTGLEIYNADVLVKGKEYFIIDINDFPSFEEVIRADLKISDYIISKH